MEHATALVDHDATPHICGCQRLVDAGWTVRCAACGRGMSPAERAGMLDMHVEFFDGIAEVLVDDVDPDDAYDAQRDAELVDEAERRVA